MEENNNFLYKGYLLVIDVGGWCFDAECRELKMIVLLLYVYFKE